MIKVTVENEDIDNSFKL